MAYIYAYAPDEVDTANIGLVGALFDQDAYYDVQAGEFGELSFRHPIDPYGKWQVLANGVMLKTAIPVRLVPELEENGSYVSSVDEYRVSASATQYQRYVYYAVTSSKDPTVKVKKKEKTKHKKLLKKGTKVYVIADPRPNDDTYRYKVRVGSGKKKVTGYMEKAGLTLIQQEIPVPATENGLETVSPSYAVQDQLFRIYSVDTEMTQSSPGSVVVHARRLVYDLLGNITTYKATTNVKCQAVCRGILNNTVFPHPFEVHSDIGDKHVGIDCQNLNVIEALLDPDNGIAAHWHTEVVCDDYDIYVLHKAGKNRGIKIRHATNMQGIRVQADYSGVATAIRPVGENSAGRNLYLDGHVINGRCGYNYNSTTHTCADWLDEIAEGFRWAIDEDGDRKTSVIERTTDDGYPIPKAYALTVQDAKVTKQKKDDDPAEQSILTTAQARVMLAKAAIEMFQNGCDSPEISMDVDFTLLGDTEEYAQYRHLEPLFIYDDVAIQHNDLGVYATEQLTSIRWDVRAERVTEATFGSLGDAVAQIPGFSLPSINGGKIINGTITGGQIGTDAISLDHMQANSVNTDVLMARSITGEKIQAGEITADHLAAHAIDTQLITAQQAVVDAIIAGTISTGTLAAEYANIFEAVATKMTTDFSNIDELSAAIANIDSLNARYASFDVETVQNLIGQLILARQIGTRLCRIDNLYVTQANLLNVTLDRLTILGADGNYYDLAVGSDGIITATERDPDTVNEYTGQTDDGRNVVDGSDMESEVGYDIPDFDEQDFMVMEDGLQWLTVAALSTGKLRATEAYIGTATIPQLEATAITALSQSLNLTANQTIQLLLGTDANIRAWFSFTDDGLVVRKTDSKWHTVTDANGFYIDHDEVAGHVGAFHNDTFEPRSIRMGNIICKASSNGGWVWNVAPTQ